MQSRANKPRFSGLSAWCQKYHGAILWLAWGLVVGGICIELLYTTRLIPSPWPASWVSMLIEGIFLLLIACGSIIIFLSCLGIIPGPQLAILSGRRRVITFIVFLVCGGLAALLFLKILNVILLSLTDILGIGLTMFSIVLALFQITPLLDLSKTSEQITVPQILPDSSIAPLRPLNASAIYLPSIDTLGTLPAYFEVSTPSKRDAFRYIESLQPLTDPRTILQREKVVREVYELLVQPDLTAVVLTGISGNGKSTLAALVYDYAERQRKAGIGLFKAKAIWLTVDPSVTIVDLVGTLYKRLDMSFSDIQSLAPQYMAIAFFNAINAIEQPCLLILDEFQSLLDSQTGRPRADRPGIGEWLDSLNNQPCTCRVLLTCSFYSQSLHKYPSTYLQEYRLPPLNTEDGWEMLCKQGIAKTPEMEQEVHLAVEKCQGHIHALALMAALLRDNRSLNLTTLLHDPSYAGLWIGDIAHNLLNRMYTDQLNKQQRKLLRVFSLYREPVPLEAVQPFFSAMSLRDSLKVLLKMDLLQATGACHYQLHALVSAYGQNQFVEGDEQANRRALEVGHACAADYYRRQAAATSPVNGRWQNICDMHLLIEACWHLCQAKQQQTAFELMEGERMFMELGPLGGNSFLFELCQLLLSSGQWQPQPLQAALIYTHLASSCDTLGQKKEALKYFGQALALYRQLGDHEKEASALNNLGNVSADLGNTKEACKYYEQTLILRKKIEDHHGEGITLNNLGKIYNMQNKKKEAISYYQKALEVMRSVDDQHGEGAVLNNLGKVYSDLGRREEALRYYNQALDIRRRQTDLWGEGITLNNLGGLYDEWGKKEEAMQYYMQALDIRRQLADRWGEGATLHNLGRLYDRWGNKEEALDYYETALNIKRKVGDRLGEASTLNNLGGIYNALGKQENAQQYYEHALHIERELGDLGGEGATLHNLGWMYADLGKKTEALDHYRQALHVRRLAGDRRGEGITLHNMGVLYFGQSQYDVALASLILARTIFEEIKSPNCYTSQKWINKLRRKLGIQYPALEARVKTQAMLIVDQALCEKS